jgi:hypothetical protein
MKALLLLPALVILALSTLANAADPAAKGEPSTVAFVKKLYQAHDSEKGPFADVTKAGLDQWFAPSLSTVLLKALTKSDEPIIDFDPFYYAQDMEIKDMKIVQEVNEDDAEASVLVTYRNFDKPMSLRLHLSNTEKGWRVTNVIYATSDLRTIVSE